MKPSNEWLKLNVDAVFFSELRSIGFGCVLRNSIGELISTMAIPILFNLAPKEAEIIRLHAERYSCCVSGGQA